MDRNHFISVVIFTIVLALVPHWINAKTVAGVGEYDFGADISENDSCDKALTRAESDAVERAFGVVVGATDWEMCNNETCDFRSMSWTETFGHVVEIKNINKVILNNPRRCRVSIVAYVEQLAGIDPNFSLDVVLNRTVYNNGDVMTVDLDPSKGMYVHLFNWTEQYGFLLMDVKLITEPTQMPTEQFIQYKTINQTETVSKEMIVIIASDSRLDFKTKYTTNQFVKMSQKLARMGVLIRKISYEIQPE
jgi:hypothetical protein